MRLSLSLSAAALLLLAGCAGDQGDAGPSPASPSPGVPQTTPAGTASPTAGTLTVTSSAFRDGQPIPRRHSCKGDNTPPPLAWTGVPADTAALALVVDDPDAVGGLYIHWVVTDIPPSSTDLAAGRPPAGARVTPNSGGDPSYLGPCPPAGTGVHHYRFTLYAVAEELKLAANTPARDAVAAIKRGAVAQARLVGTYRG